MLEVLQRQGVVVVGVPRLLLLVLQRGDARLLLSDLALRPSGLRLEQFQHTAAHLRSPLVGQLVGLPVLENGVLDALDRDMTLRAPVVVLLPAKAVEVRVLATATVGEHDAEATTTAAAEQSALERMRPALR